MSLDQFSFIEMYTAGYDRFYQLRRLNCEYNKALTLAKTEITANEEEAKDILRNILKEYKYHMEARALLNYLCLL